ncbi:MAG: hypothetical protein DRJ01_10670 [Bacteroidetes bacterium]|nr:MAG: hypothetical protein DRJ01_10670 [Bacteroidota bacterium]
MKFGLLAAGSFLSYKIAKVVSAAMVAAGMSIDINPQTKVDMQGVQLTTNIDITNPTDSSMELTSPFVQLFHNDENIAKNEVSKDKFEIKPFSKTRLPIVLNLSWSQIQSLLDSINISFPTTYTNLQKALWMYDNYKLIINKLGLNVKYSTYANGISYKDSQTIKI